MQISNAAVSKLRKCLLSVLKGKKETIAFADLLWPVGLWQFTPGHFLTLSFFLLRKGRFNYLLNDNLFLAATALDFRFKKFEFIADRKVRSTKLAAAKKLLGQWNDKIAPTSTAYNNLSNALRNSTNTRPQQAPTGSSLLRKLQDKSVPPCAPSRFSVEFDQYMAQDLAETDDNSLAIAQHGPLYFYQKHSAKFPQISKIARIILSMPVTSVPVESLFSQVGLTQTDLRNRLSPDLLESLTLIKNHL